MVKHGHQVSQSADFSFRFYFISQLLQLTKKSFGEERSKIEFTVSNKPDIFSPIMAPDKKVAEYDYVYRDQKGILAYLDCRDSELYKIDENTTDVLFVVQGNEATTVQYRMAALTRVCNDLRSIMPDIESKVEVISSEN